MNNFSEIIMDYYPVVVSFTTGHEPSQDDMKNFFDELETKLESKTGQYAFISYGKQPTYIAKDVRALIAKRSVELTKKMQGRELGVILVPHGFIGVLITKTIALFDPVLKGTVIAKSLDEALDEVARLFEENNIPLPNLTELKSGLIPTH